MLLLLLVLVPGLGHAVNGSRRWLRARGPQLPGVGAARVLVLIYVASYAVRREKELREQLPGTASSRSALLALAGAAAARGTGLRRRHACCSRPASALLFLAGARLRYVLAMTADRRRRASRCWRSVLELPHAPAHRLPAIPGPIPFNSGFQLTQSLIAIGRGQWFGVGLGDSVQKLFYLPEAHTDFLFAVLAEELGLVGVALTLRAVPRRWCGARLRIARAAQRTRA